jgi:peptidoglycan hydrolase-like protein with peptidoglycan-binding domain
MGWRTSRPRGVTGAGVLAMVLLAGCGYAPEWNAAGPGGAPAAPTSAAGGDAGWEPPVLPDETTGTATPTPTPSLPPTPSVSPTPTASATATPRPSPSPTTKPRTSLRYGDQGPKVLALQKRLSALGYWLGTPDGSFGSLTQQAVFALQKAAGISRDGVVGPRTKKALEGGVRPKARIRNGVEIDLDRQLLLVVRGGTVRTALNTSTGNGEEYTSTKGNRAIATTPKGDYTVYRAVDGPLTNSLGELWRPRFFNRGIAVHGSPNIPPYPASHGCARLSNAAINMIWAADLMPIGSRVLVH